MICHHTKVSLMAQMVKRLSAMQETRVQSLGWKDPLENEMAAHSSILAWKIPWTTEPGRLPSMGSQRVGHDWVTEHNISSAQCCRIISLFKSTYYSISLVQEKSLLSLHWLWKQSTFWSMAFKAFTLSFFTYPGYRPHRIFRSVFEAAIHFYTFIWRMKWQPTPVFLPGESCGQRSLVGCCP